MALSGVKCTVDSCQFWVAPNNCDAPTIEVDVNHTGLGGEAAGRTAGAGRAAGARGAGMELGELGGYWRGAAAREGAYEAGDIDVGPSPGGPGGGTVRARRSEHTCCRTFRPRT